MRVLIIGAGIGGLSLARMLHDRGINAVIIEKAPSLQHIGYVIAIWKIGCRILETMGLLEKLRAVGKETKEAHVLDKQGTFLKTWPLSLLGSFLLVDRADVHSVLSDAARDVPIRFATTVDAIRDHGSGVDVVFHDGTQETYDVVVGADGTYSQTRAMIFGECKRKDFGWQGAIFWLQNHPSFPEDTMEIWGDGRVFVFTSHGSKDRLCVYVGASRRYGVLEGSNGEEMLQNIRTIFHDFAEPVQEAFRQLEDPEKIYLFTMEDIAEHVWNKGRVAIIGDASHAIIPRSGLGASLALEDAYVLAEELSCNEDPREALQRYGMRRAPRVAKARHASVKAWHLFAVQFQGIALLRNLALRWIPMTSIVNAFRSLIEEQP